MMESLGSESLEPLRIQGNPLGRSRCSLTKNRSHYRGSKLGGLGSHHPGITRAPVTSPPPRSPLPDASPAASLRREIALWRSDKMQEVWKIIQQAAGVDVTVLISGETGTGKDLVARAIHQLSSRQRAPYVAVNCAAVPRDLLESELFGHERGAFTGAHQLQDRQVRIRRSRNNLPRRDRRSSPCAPGQAASRPAGRHVLAGRAASPR